MKKSSPVYSLLLLSAITFSPVIKASPIGMMVDIYCPITQGGQMSSLILEITLVVMAWKIFCLKIILFILNPFR